MNSSMEQEPKSLSRSAAVSLAFFGVGLLTFVLSLVLLVIQPEVLSGDPRRAEVLALTHMLTLGWMSSLIFGTIYTLVPLTAAARLRSVPLAWVHLFFHVQGLILMVLGFFETPFAEVSHGGTFMFVGLLLFFLNLYLTAAKFNRWEPANITIIMSLFWLLASGVTGVLLFLNQHLEFADDPEGMIALHAHFGLVGFVWLMLIGSGLKIFSMFLVGGSQPGLLSWVGFCLVNLALFLWIPAGLLPEFPLQAAINWMLLAGALAYLIEKTRLCACARERMGWGLTTALLGYVLGIFILVWIQIGSPNPLGESLTGPEWVRAYFVVAVLGPASFILFGLASRLVPFLYAQMRLLADPGKPAGKAVFDSTRSAAELPIFVCLVLGIGYVTVAQLLDQTPGVQLGAVCLLVASGWLAYLALPWGKEEAKAENQPENVQMRKFF